MIVQKPLQFAVSNETPYHIQKLISLAEDFETKHLKGLWEADGTRFVVYTKNTLRTYAVFVPEQWYFNQQWFHQTFGEPIEDFGNGALFIDNQRIVRIANGGLDQIILEELTK